jgi:hypothetical protein
VRSFGGDQLGHKAGVLINEINIFLRKDTRELAHPVFSLACENAI